ncbi:MAG: transcriptional repressor [Patescibacteria group bacterium]|nr:transcriptional repressor [Patescibacteria group bacterium]
MTSKKNRSRHQQEIKSIIEEMSHLFSFTDLIDIFKKKKISIHRTTIYRNLKKLITEGKIIFVSQEGKKTFFEKASDKDNHHHLICQKCLKIFSFKEDELDRAVASAKEKIEEQTSFRIKTFRFDLFGQCYSCSKKSE